MAEASEQPVRLVLDTSVFTNPETARQWGDSTAAALAAFVASGRRAGRRIELFMPPSIYEEIRTFVEDDELPPDLELVISLRAPSRYSVHVPGSVLYDLIDDIRGRIDRGLRVAERAVREAAPEKVERTITRLRERYREALRSGLLDSREDVDVILLARELGAAVVSSDNAVVRWAEDLGLRLISPAHLRRLLESAGRQLE